MNILLAFRPFLVPLFGHWLLWTQKRHGRPA